MFKKILSREKIDIFFLCTMLLLLFLTVVFVVPFNEAPDEAMRYQIAKYVYQHMSLPRGDNPEILNPIWGISYAFTPINSYIFSGILMKIVSVFGVQPEHLYYYARLISVAFSMGTALFCYKIGKKLFTGIYVWLFVILVTLLPEFIFISGYVNCDAIAVFSVAWIVYALLCGKEKQWDTKSCLFLGVGLGCCALSYYNAYGMIIFAVVYCVWSVCMDKTIDNKVQFLLQKTAWVALAAIIVAGWWFVRNGILYDGDILGLSASSNCAELNALEEYRPSNRSTPYKLGYSLEYVLFDMEWIELSMLSFVAAFGYMQYFIDEIYCDWYFYIIGFGLVFKLIDCIFKIFSRKKTSSESSVRLKQWTEGTSFWICMFLTCITTIGISLYYAYFNDFQAQGRYSIPMLVPMSLIITGGFQFIGEKINVHIGKMLAIGASMYMFFLAMYSIFGVLVTLY